MRILVTLLFLNLFLNTALAQQQAEGIYWDQDKGILTYNITKDGLLKIRAGSSSGPVYRTLVNLEERKAGLNQQPWDGRDESGAIDFKEYGPLHFCIDTRPQSKKDILLFVNSTLAPMQNSTLSISPRSSSLTLDIKAEDKEWFSKGTVEIMAFLDNRLIKLERVKSFPYLLNLDIRPSGERQLLILNAWSADHSALAYQNLFILSAAEKEVSIIRAKEPPRPLTGKIAYCQHSRGFWQVQIADLDGTNPRQLTQSLVDKRYPCFSPDGKRIAYVTNAGELWIIDKEGRNNQKIPLSIYATQPRWSPDGRAIVFVSYQDLYHGDSEIWEIDLKTAKLSKLSKNRPWLQYDPCLSPDGSNIIFTDGPELYAQEIRKLDRKTGDITQLTDNRPYDYDMQPAYFPDGQMIAYSSNENGSYDIWVMDKFGQNKKNLSRAPATDILPQVSVDARWIFFLSDRSGNFQVWQMDVQGANLRRITNSKTDIQDLTLYTELK